MSSLLGKALRPQNSLPVPMAGQGFFKLPGLATGGSAAEAYMSSYGTVGTIFSMVSLYAASTARPLWQMFREEQTDPNRYTKRDEGSDQRKQVFNHQALKVLNNPNPFWSRFALMEISQMYLDLTGESFWVVERDPRSSIPLHLWSVRPDRMTPVPDEETYLKGWVYSAPDGMEKIPLTPDEVIFNRYPNPLDPYRGLGPVQSVLVDIDAAKYSAEWNRNFFINSAEPGGVIEVDHEVDDDEWHQLSERWRESHRGVSRAHRVAVLEGGQKWVPNQHTMRDMDFGNLRGVMRDVMREAFRMHKVMLGVSDDVNRANAQTGEEVFSSWGVVPRLDRWKDVLYNSYLPLFGSTGQGVEFDYVTPVPANREQDNQELTAKSHAAYVLRMAGYNGHDVLKVVGLPDMNVTDESVLLTPAGGKGGSVAPAGPDQPPPDQSGIPGESSGADGGGVANLLPWSPFELSDRRFSKVNGHPLVRTP